MNRTADLPSVSPSVAADVKRLFCFFRSALLIALFLASLRLCVKKFRSRLLASLALLLLAPLAASAQSEFGSSQFSEAALVGSLYDLKQTQNHRPTAMDQRTYGAVVDEFLSSGWSEAVLNRYYRVTRPLYTTQIFMPVMPASRGPAAFGVESLMKSSLWVVHYKGQVAAPSDGEWRFWGYGGEICAAAVNGKTVLVANHVLVQTPLTHWKSTEPPGQRAGSGHLVAGDWIPLKAGQIIDLDVLIGERGGSTFDCFLLIEKKGESYGISTSAKGAFTLFPIFQLAPFDTVPPSGSTKGPQFAPKGPIWKAFQ